MGRKTRNSTGFIDPQQLDSLPKRRNSRKPKKVDSVEELKKEPDKQSESDETQKEEIVQNGDVEESNQVIAATDPNLVSEETEPAVGGSPNIINTCYSPTVGEDHDDSNETTPGAVHELQKEEPKACVTQQNSGNGTEPSAFESVSVDHSCLEEAALVKSEKSSNETLLLLTSDMPETSPVVQNVTKTIFAADQNQYEVAINETLTIVQVEPMDTTEMVLAPFETSNNTSVDTNSKESESVEMKFETPVTSEHISVDTSLKKSEVVEVKVEILPVSENIKVRTANEPETNHKTSSTLDTLFGSSSTVNEPSSSSSFLGPGSFFAAKQEPGVIPGLDFDAVEDVSDKVEQISFGSIMAKKMFASEPEPAAETNMNEIEKTDIKDEDKSLRRSSRIRSQESGRSRRREVVFSNRNGTSSGASSRSQSDTRADDEDVYHSFELQHLRSPSRDSVSSRSSSYVGGSPESDDDDKNLKSRTKEDEDLAECVSSVDIADRASSRKAVFVPPKDLIRMPGHIAFTASDDELKEKLKTFDGIEESRFFTERRISKESKSMVCDCFLSKEDIQRGEIGCNEDCLNRLLMVECGSRCPTGDRCTNKRFQRKEYCPLEVFKTEKKGHGLRTLAPLSEGGFVIEYVGEVLNPRGFTKRTKEYAKKEQEHFYFMALTSDTIIDATLKGNCSRFINHSCEPNCETQKWTVNGEVRIGFFAQRDLRAGEEITFDYQFQRYGKKAQRCFCMTESCRGWIGGDEEDEEEFEDDDEAKDADHDGVAVRKPKPKTPRKRGKRVTSEVNEFGDRFYEDLKTLETSGLKNKNHTLNLCRLMVRAEDWESRDRILNILINGDQPCRRLFLDYRGLRLLYGWMSTLPVLTNAQETEHYHLKFLEALEVLPIPNKTLLKDSEILDLVEKWSSEVNLKKDVKAPNEYGLNDQQQVEQIVKEQTESGTNEQVAVTPEQAKESVERVTEEEWNYVKTSRELLSNWADLKEVFRIPKKERVEQMKEHEREADKADNVQKENDKQSEKESLEREKFSQRKFDRKFNLRDFFQAVVKSGYVRPSEFKHLSKEQKRHLFEKYIETSEKQQQHEQMNANLQVLHTERCKQLNLNYQTVPYVDPTGLYWLEPSSMTWNAIEMDDLTLNPGVKAIAHFVHNPPPPEVFEPQLLPPQEHQEVSFPPWPESFPPPPPLVPANLPSGWAISFDENGRLYFYHARTRITQWELPTNQTLDFCDAPSSSDSSDMEDDGGETNDETNQFDVDENFEPTIKTKKISKSEERRARRKLSGLVQEKIISPRNEEDKPALTQKMIKQRKLELMTERVQGTLYDDDDDVEGETVASLVETAEVRPPSRKKRRTSKSSSVTSTSSVDSSSIASTDDLEELNLVAFGGPEVATSVSSESQEPNSQVTSIKLKSHERKRSHKKAKSHAKEPSANPHSSSKGSKERKIQEDAFRMEIANLIKQYLNPFRKPECNSGKITSTEHFKHLARKLTHMVTAKEIKHCKNSKQNEILSVTESVKHKAKEFVRKYMARFNGRDYVPSPENPGSVATGSES